MQRPSGIHFNTSQRRLLTMVSALQNSLTRRMSRSRSSVKRPPKQLACGRTGSRCDNSADRLTHCDAMPFGSLNGTVKLVSLPGRCQDRWSAGDLPQSIVKLHYTPPPAANAPGRLDAVAWFTPFHDSDRNPHGQDNFQDYDLGSAGPLAIPGMGLVVGAVRTACSTCSIKTQHQSADAGINMRRSEPRARALY